MATTIFPTINDVGDSGKGKTITEANLSNLVAALCGATGFVISGFAFGTSADLTVTVAAGQALIGGYLVTTDTPLTRALTPSAVNYVYLQLTRDASQNVTGVALTHNTTGSAPTDAILLGTATTSASAITNVDLSHQWHRAAGLLGVGQGAAGGAARLFTPNGYLDLGPKNSSHAHFATDRADFHFNRDVLVQGTIYAGVAYNIPVALQKSSNNLITSNNELNFVDTFAGGEIWFNYRGAAGAISRINIGSGRADGILAGLRAASFMNASGYPAAISGAPAASGSGSVGDSSATTITHGLGRIPLILISSSAGNVGMVLENVGTSTFTVYNRNGGGNTNNFNWYAW